MINCVHNDNENRSNSKKICFELGTYQLPGRVLVYLFYYTSELVRVKKTKI